MIDPRIVISAFCLYMGFLFLVALWVERKSAAGKGPANHPLVYSLSLAVYCTAWTYYGSVGKAATSGVLFLPIYLGPTIAIFLWWTVLRKLVRLKDRYRITSIADFISARYNKSQLLAALTTVIAILGIVPYIALQLKAIISTFELITTPSSGAASSWIGAHFGPVMVIILSFFTIILGVRRLDPTERHEGMVMALAAECLIKLLAFLMAGIFVTYYIYGGFGDIFQRLSESPFQDLIGFWGKSASTYFTWTSYLLLSMSAILFLPRQFHVAVVENSNEKHILTAMWSFPLYMLLINIFVVPIAVGGLLQGYPIREADNFVLLLPLRHAGPWLPLLVFIGGFSAAAGMIMISSVTMATMITNHLLLPFLGWVPRLGFLKRHLLKCRWAAVAVFILFGYWFEEHIIETLMLVNIGLISFAAVLQFAPVILGGIFWRRANEAGAILGLGGGFSIWCYTQLLPSFVRSGWLPHDLLEDGPWGIEFLRPEGLFGLASIDPISQTVLWSMVINISLYVLGCLYFEQSEEEQSLSQEFVGVLDSGMPLRRVSYGEAYIDPALKRIEIENLLGQYFSEAESNEIIERCIKEAGVQGKKRITIAELVELHSVVERHLAGAIGSAAAYKALHQVTFFTAREARELSEQYGEILANLRVTPGELKRKIDYYQEREMLFIHHAGELEVKVAELQSEIIERKRAQEALRESEERYRGLVETMNEGLEIEDENGVITYVNKRLCEMWGCSRDEIIGRRVSDFIDTSQLDMLREQKERRTRGEIVAYEATWLGKDERRVFTIVSSVPMFRAAGLYRGSFSVLTDISHIKALEREKANLISMFVHDMRSSLTGIHGLGVRLLNKSSAMDEERRNELLRIINREASKLESLVDDFIEFSRLEAGKLKLNFAPVSLERELIELFDTYRVRASQNQLQLELHIDEALSVIEADANRLRRVFTNLLDNALKFSREKGTITLVVRETEDEIVIGITDQGTGIHPEELPFIFDLFHRGRDEQRKEGHGIGLAAVKAIVEGHGGRVQVTSRPGKGSTFTVFLPKKPESRI